MIIGSKGGTIKAIQSEFTLRQARVDRPNRQVILSGRRQDEEDATDHIMQMFSQFTLSQTSSAYALETAHFLTVRHGPDFAWRFQEKILASDPKNKEYKYVLVKDANSETRANGDGVDNPAILVFDDLTTDFIQEKLAPLDQDPLLKAKLILGRTFYLPLTLEVENKTFSWL